MRFITPVVLSIALAGAATVVRADDKAPAKMEKAKTLYDRLGGKPAITAVVKDFLGNVLTSSRHLLRLINDVLDLARVESGKLEFRLATVDLAQLVTQVADRLQMTTNEHTIEVDVDETDDTAITGDRDHLEQVLDNLVTNAIKFSPDGGVVRVVVRRDGDEVLLSVHDPGVGISPHQLDAIFGLFYQAEDPVSRRTGGVLRG